PYAQSVMSSPGVAHEWPHGETYLGWMELAVHDEGVLGELLTRVDAHEFADHIAAIHTYPVREIYTIISGGRPTEVGLRGYPALQTIIAVGADGQRNEAVLNLVYGDAV